MNLPDYAEPYLYERKSYSLHFFGVLEANNPIVCIPFFGMFDEARFDLGGGGGRSWLERFR